MRLYKEKSIGRFNKSDLLKNGILGIMLIIGLALCPKGDLYNIDYSDIKFQSVGILLVTMSIIYFLVNLSVNSSLKRIALRSFAAIIIVISTIISMLFIASGGIEVIVGLAIFCGCVLGLMLNYII